MENKTIEYENNNITLKVCNYENNNRLAILAYKTINDEYYDDITINIPEYHLEKDEVFLNCTLNNYLSNLLKQLKKNEIIEKSLGYITINFAKIEIVKINIEKLKEYDKKGVEEAFRRINKNYKI